MVRRVRRVWLSTIRSNSDDCCESAVGLHAVTLPTERETRVRDTGEDDEQAQPVWCRQLGKGGGASISSIGITMKKHDQNFPLAHPRDTFYYKGRLKDLSWVVEVDVVATYVLILYQ